MGKKLEKVLDEKETKSVVCVRLCVRWQRHTSDINKIVQQRIDQTIKTGGTEVERIAPKKI